MKCIGARGDVKHQLVEDVRVGQRNWRDRITNVGRDKVQQRADKDQPVGVDVTFTVDRPSSHFGTGRNRFLLNARAPMWPTTKNTNDVDKMLRLLLDALQDSGVLVDDAQAVETAARKAYPQPKPEALQGPKPPPWAGLWVEHWAGRRSAPVSGALPFPGARVLIYPLDDEGMTGE